MKNPYNHSTFKMSLGERQNADELQAKCDFLSALPDDEFYEYCKANNIPAHLYGANARKKTDET